MPESIDSFLSYSRAVDIIERQPDPLAADTSLLQAASSFLAPASTQNDPKADYSFIQAATAFCDGANLFVPLPKATSGEKPLFLTLWQERDSVRELPSMDLTDEAYFSIAESLKAGFIEFVQGTSVHVAQWAAFQFDPKVNAQYLSRADVEPMVRVAPLVREMIRNNQVARLCKAFRKQQLKEPIAFAHLVGNPDFPSLDHLALSYVFSVYARGWSYAMGLDQLEARPIYHYHWLRASALRTDIGLQLVRTKPQTSGFQFPWGQILRSIIASSRGGCVSPERVRDAMVALRERSDAFRAAIQNIPHKQITFGLSEGEQLVIEELLAVDLPPKYLKTAGAEKLAEWLKQLGGIGPSWSKVVAEMVSATFQPEWARTTEAAFRIQFRRSTFWDVFDDSGIRSAARNARGPD